MAEPERPVLPYRSPFEAEPPPPPRVSSRRAAGLASGLMQLIGWLAVVVGGLYLVQGALADGQQANDQTQFLATGAVTALLGGTSVALARAVGRGSPTAARTALTFTLALWA